MVAKSPFVWTADVFPARGQNGGPGGALPSVERPTVKSSAPRGTPRFKYGLRQCSTNGAPSFAPRRYGAGRTRPQEKSAAPTCVEIKILRRVRAESSRRPPRHRRDACSMAWQCRFLAARPSQDGRVVAENPTHRLISTQILHRAGLDPELPPGASLQGPLRTVVTPEAPFEAILGIGAHPPEERKDPMPK